jgi:dTDP-4-dehydrorhamnose 3,5-epimerase
MFERMQARKLGIPEVILITPSRHSDARGFFSETYNRVQFADIGIDHTFVQDNHTLSSKKGTVRGLHFQSPPHAQDKLIRVCRGAVLDVAVDIRHGSPSFGKFVTAILSAENWHQLWVPKGFAHGFCTLEPETEVIYKVTDLYAPEHDKGLAWDDPDLGIQWPVSAEAAILTDKDRRHPQLYELPAYFNFAREK